MIKKIINTLNGVRLNGKALSIGYLVRPTEFPSITFELHNTGTKLAGDGKSKVEGGNLQVDIWTKSITGLDELCEEVKSKIKQSLKVGLPTEYTNFENDTKIYHTVIDYEYLKERGN